jgi:hypothetical protein
MLNDDAHLRPKYLLTLTQQVEYISVARFGAKALFSIKAYTARKFEPIYLCS